MNAIKIDPTTKTVTAVTLTADADGSTLQGLYDLIECDYVSRVVLDGRHDLWLDDEGLLHEPQPPKFMLGSFGPFAGIGLVCGYTPDGETAPAVIPAEVVQHRVKWLGDQHVAPRIGFFSFEV